MTGAMEKLRAVIKSHDDNFSSKVLSDESGVPIEQVSSLIHTLICNREIHKREKIDHVQQYNQLPVPQWF